MGIHRIKKYRLSCDLDLRDDDNVISRCLGTIDVEAPDRYEALLVAGTQGWNMRAGRHLSCPDDGHLLW